MKRLFPILSVAAALVACGGASLADEEKPAEAEKPAEEEKTPAGGEVAGKSQALAEKPFFILPLCRMLEGSGDVRKPQAEEWEPLEEGHFYPLGCAYRTTTPATRLVIQFGKEVTVEVVGVAAFSTRTQPLEVKDRVVLLGTGKIKVSTPRNFPENLFSVTAPGFTAASLQGDSTYDYRQDAEGSFATVRCVTGTFRLEGRHFVAPTLRAANEFDVRTTADLLFTGLYGKSGDVALKLEQGVVRTKDPATGVTKEESRTLDWKLSPKTAVRIHRAVPEIGERMAVTVMTFDEKGELRNRCAFAEGRPEINSGELGPKTEVSEKKKEAIAKEAAEAAKDAEAVEETEESETKKPAKDGE